MPEISFTYSAWWLVPIILGAALVSTGLYRSESSYRRGQRILLGSLRFLILAGLGILLLEPVLRWQERVEERPELVWLRDISASMRPPDTVRTESWQSAIPEAWRAPLEEKYELREWAFAEKLVEPSDSFREAGTDMAGALKEIRERYYNQNLGAVVLLSDGIYNRGGDPAYAAQNLPFPVFAVGYGDTNRPRDLRVAEVVHNPFTYINNRFPVEVHLRADDLDGTDYELTVRQGNRPPLHRHRGTVNGERYFERLEFFLPAEKAGLQRYQVAVTLPPGDKIPANNQRSFSLEVIDDQVEIALIAGAPHPDMAALNQAISGLEKYRLRTYLPGQWPEETPDLFVLHNPADDQLTRVMAAGKPLWLWRGNRPSATALLEYLSVRAGTREQEEVQAQPDPDFAVFGLTEEQRKFLNDLPPLYSAFGPVQAPGDVNPLFHKKVGRVASREPLWYYRSGNDQPRQIVVLGTGLWRWRLHAYRQTGSHHILDEILQKSLQYLSARDEVERFSVEMAQRFDRQEQIQASARLLNAGLELTNAPEVSIRFTSESGEQYDFSFARSQQTYRLITGGLPPGSYSWQAQTELAGESFTDRGSLIVEDRQLEQRDRVARHGLLQKITAATGGKFVVQDQLDTLLEALLENEQARSFQYLELRLGSLLEKEWIFLVLLLWLTLEWALRKYFGRT